MRQITLILLLISLNAAAQRPEYESNVLTETFGFDDNTPIAVPFDSLVQACPARDCIPSIDDPKFVAADAADHVNGDDLVLAVKLNGETKAYPSKILLHHEIVNDSFGGEPVVVSYCPLCGSGVAFRRELDDEAVEFGVSGVLHESDLVLYDRSTESLWAQITGEAIMGPKTGAQLQEIPVTMTTWQTWRERHPDTLLLSTDTGFDDKDYTQDRYGDYRESDRLFLPVSATDARLHVKKLVYGAIIGDQPVAYEATWLQETGRLQENIDGHQINVEYHSDGSVTVTNAESGQSYPVKRLFWFAWYTFHPQTLLRVDERNK